MTNLNLPQPNSVSILIIGGIIYEYELAITTITLVWGRTVESLRSPSNPYICQEGTHLV
jgi:hypothetical protein